jgi:hypothetical protein
MVTYWLYINQLRSNTMISNNDLKLAVKAKTADLVDSLGLTVLAYEIRSNKKSALDTLACIKSSGIKNPAFMQQIQEFIRLADKYHA